MCQVTKGIMISTVILEFDSCPENVGSQKYLRRAFTLFELMRRHGGDDISRNHQH